MAEQEWQPIATAPKDGTVAKVARAIASVVNKGFADTYLAGDFEDEARAAIEAMRTPSGGMQADMRDAIEPYVQRGLSKPVTDQWQIGRETWAAGIDAALSHDEVKG